MVLPLEPAVNFQQGSKGNFSYSANSESQDGLHWCTGRQPLLQTTFSTQAASEDLSRGKGHPSTTSATSTTSWWIKGFQETDQATGDASGAS